MAALTASHSASTYRAGSSPGGIGTLKTFPTPRSDARPVPGYAGHWCSETKRIVGVPLDQRLGPVAVVHVPVDDQDPSGAARAVPRAPRSPRWPGDRIPSRDPPARGDPAAAPPRTRASPRGPTPPPRCRPLPRRSTASQLAALVIVSGSRTPPPRRVASRVIEIVARSSQSWSACGRRRRPRSWHRPSSRESRTRNRSGDSVAPAQREPAGGWVNTSHESGVMSPESLRRVASAGSPSSERLARSRRGVSKAAEAAQQA